VRAVETETCNTGLRWVGGDRPNAEMRAGSDCVGCHEETGARPLVIGGTVYPTYEFAPENCYGIEGVEVVVVDANGRVRSTMTNRAGNFYFEAGESDFRMPYSADIRYGAGDDSGLALMVTSPRYGGCARCHALPQNADGSGDFLTPSMFRSNPEDPEYVFGAGPIFVPGLLTQ
jgi:cytochrome c553